MVTLTCTLEAQAVTGRIVILNGAPRSGKSAIAHAMQAGLPGNWINLGVDAYNRAMPPELLPGIGLRPGGERPELEPALPGLWFALYDSIAAHARLDQNVVADVGHHDGYTRPLNILPACARRMAGLHVLFVGIRCPIEVIMARRNADPDSMYIKGPGVPEPVQRWQDAVHVPGIYDLELDTGTLTPQACVARINAVLEQKPTAFARLAAL